MFKVVQQDILTLVNEVDVVVCSCNPAMRSAGGVCGVIHRAAGRGLANYLFAHRPFGLHTTEVEVTPGFELGVPIIHAVAPVWGVYKARHLNMELLANTYSNVFNEAHRNEWLRIAVPSLATGIYKFPIKDAAEVVAEVLTFYPDLDITLTVLEDEYYHVYSEMHSSLPTSPTGRS